MERLLLRKPLLKLLFPTTTTFTAFPLQTGSITTLELSILGIGKTFSTSVTFGSNVAQAPTLVALTTLTTVTSNAPTC